MAAYIGPWVGLEVLRQVVEQVLEIDAFRTIAGDFNRDGIRRLLGNLEQVDEPLQGVQRNPPVTVLIQQSEGLTGFKGGIANLKSQQQAPIPQADRTIAQTMGLDRALEILKREFGATLPCVLNHLSSGDSTRLEAGEQAVKGLWCEAGHGRLSNSLRG